MMKVKFKAMDKDTKEWLYFNIDKDISKLFKIDHDTVCMCTGLQDANGKDIYEGDILARSDKRDSDQIGYLEYGHFSLWSEWEDGDEVYGFSEVSTFPFVTSMISYLKDNCNLYIIGNIYTDKDLVERINRENEINININF